MPAPTTPYSLMLACVRTKEAMRLDVHSSSAVDTLRGALKENRHARGHAPAILGAHALAHDAVLSSKPSLSELFSPISLSPSLSPAVPAPCAGVRVRRCPRQSAAVGHATAARWPRPSRRI
eukprot:6214493-Pleurochrysis_carterae.AAC.2